MCSLTVVINRQCAPWLSLIFQRGRPNHPDYLSAGWSLLEDFSMCFSSTEKPDCSPGVGAEILSSGDSDFQVKPGDVTMIVLFLQVSDRFQELIKLFHSSSLNSSEDQPDNRQEAPDWTWAAQKAPLFIHYLFSWKVLTRGVSSCYFFKHLMYSDLF